MIAHPFRIICGLLVVTLTVATATGVVAAEPIASPSTTTRPTAGNHVACFRLKLADQQDVEQASGLVHGRIGDREGLWIVCDRNSTTCGNQVLFIDDEALDKAQPGGTVLVTTTIPIRPPRLGWPAFAAAQSGLPDEVCATLARQLAATGRGPDRPLDLEGVAIGRSASQPDKLRLFVVAEQPYSTVLELTLAEASGCVEAVIEAAYHYAERADQAGLDHNDGLEGISWTGRPGEFYLAEEGTAPHSKSNKMLFFARPRLMRAALHDGVVDVDEPWSAKATAALQACQVGPTHTLNALDRLDDDHVLAVDRNGGTIYITDVKHLTVEPLVGLYDPALLNLRARLDAFPAKRRMPYVSIEGLAVAPDGTFWMVDDPAMPEGFRASCLVRADLATAKTLTANGTQAK